MPWNLAKLVKTFSWNHCTSTPHRSETNGIAERAVRRVKEGTSAVLLQSGLDENWWADSVECYCFLQNIQDLLSDGKTPFERRFGIHFNGPVIPFGAMVEYHPISANDQSRLHQFGAKVLPGMFLGYALYAVGIWKGDIMVADIEELEETDASELHARRLKNFHIPSRRWNSQNFWRRTAYENIHQPGIVRNDEKNKTFFKENQMKYILQLHFKKTQRGMMRKLKMTSGRSQEDSNIVITLYQESNCTCREKNHFLFQRSTLTLPEKIIEHHWNVDGEKELSDAWTGFTRFILLNERPPDGSTWPRWRLTRKQITSRPDNIWPDMWKFMSDASKRKAKQTWAIEKPKLDNARQSRGTFFIEPKDEEFKLTMKAARRKMEVPMPAAMPFKIPIKSSGENPAVLGNARWNTLVLLMPTKARD